MLSSVSHQLNFPIHMACFFIFNGRTKCNHYNTYIRFFIWKLSRCCKEQSFPFPVLNSLFEYNTPAEIETWIATSILCYHLRMRAQGGLTNVKTMSTYNFYPPMSFWENWPLVKRPLSGLWGHQGPQNWRGNLHIFLFWSCTQHVI